MKKILILSGRYLPGYKDGGPVRTIINLTNLLGDQFDFRIMTADRDHGDKKPYNNVKINNWNIVGKAKVFYSKNEKFRIKDLIYFSKNSDLIYCCGPYNVYAIKVVLLKKLHIIKKPLIIASMGTFSSGALAIKSKKKKIFFKIFNIFGLYNNIIWSVSSQIEEKQIHKYLGSDRKCIIAEDLPRNKIVEHKRQKELNKLKIIFLSRLCGMKNLIGTIDIINQVTNYEIEFDIYGNIEDKYYWSECQKKLLNLKENITWKYCGECNSENVLNTFSEYDIFLFPTFGENFGHVIGEALLAGCIPIISDKTPWQDLDKNKCGNVVRLEDFNRFVLLLIHYAKMDRKEFNIYIGNAQNYILKKNTDSIAHSGYKEVFNL